MKSIARELVIGTAFLIVASTGCADDDPVCYGPAKTTHAIGEVFEDGCRQCTCNDDTSITCVATAACDTGCDDSDGQNHDVGTFWPAGDGCNVCQCVAVGEVECTENPCGVP